MKVYVLLFIYSITNYIDFDVTNSWLYSLKINHDHKFIDK